MRRSICYCEPNTALAGEYKTWTFIYTPSTNLPKGARLKFDMQSNGREQIDWQIPSVNQKKPGPVIYMKLPKGKTISPSEVDVPESFIPHFEFVLPGAVEAGSSLTIVLGPKPGEKPTEANTLRAQTTSQRRRLFLLFVDPTGKRNYEDPETFSMDIRGNHLDHIRILSPSFVAKNKRFDVVARFEDKYGNLTSLADEDTLISFSHEYMRENLNWKLFVPETGFISLPNLYFNEAGVYTIQLVNCSTKEVFRSSPIRCFPENNHHLFWGLLHGESDRFDSTENIENCLRHFRDDKAFNFFSVSPFESQEETSNETWKTISQNIVDFDEAERFTTFLGFQWKGDPETEGLRILIYSKENKPILRKKDLKSNTLKKIYKSFSPKELISIPSFSMAKKTAYNFENFDPEFERVVEIYNAWGCSEISKKEGNSRPISSTNGVQEINEGSIQKALLRNCRFGFVAGGLDDRGAYADLYESDQKQYSAGLTAIAASAHTREALIEALYQRSCYATTGERIILGLNLASIPMGKEVSTADKPGLIINRHLSGYVAGTTKLKKIEIIRNGKVIKTFEPDHYFLDFTFDDMTPLDQVAVSAKDKKPPFVFYYIRVTQEDGHMAWSSPIWVDYIPLSAIPKNQVKQRNSKSPNKHEILDEDFEDEDEEDDEFEDFEDEE